MELRPSRTYQANSVRKWTKITQNNYFPAEQVLRDHVKQCGVSKPRTIFFSRDRLESFGFHAIVVDGHDVEELAKAFDEVWLRNLSGS